MTTSDVHDQASESVKALHDESHHEPRPLEDPATPLWVTALGVGLLVFGGILALVMHEPASETQEQATPSEEATESEDSEKAAEPPRERAPMRLMAPDSTGEALKRFPNLQLLRSRGQQPPGTP